MTDFQRARSDVAKRQREKAILDAARTLGAREGIRRVTLTDIAEAVGMHKSTMLRYFETREQIFLRLTAEGWREWSAALRLDLDARAAATTEQVAGTFARTLTDRGMFCDLLAQAPLNLERNVSLDAVRDFKLVTHAEVDAIVASVRRLLPQLSASESVDLIAAATALAGAMWQTSTPRKELAELYRRDPRLAHAIVDFPTRLDRLLKTLLGGMLTSSVRGRDERTDGHRHR